MPRAEFAAPHLVLVTSTFQDREADVPEPAENDPAVLLMAEVDEMAETMADIEHLVADWFLVRRSALDIATLRWCAGQIASVLNPS